MHTAPGAYLLCAPRAVCILDMILEHIFELKIFLQIINGPVPYAVLEYMVKEQLVLDHISRPKSSKSGSQAHSLIHNYLPLQRNL